MRAIKHPFNEAEATQIACRIIDTYGGHINFFRLMKLLYVVERRTWAKFEMPAMGGEYFSLDDGPMISEAANATKKPNFENYQFWQEHLKTEPAIKGKGNQITCIKKPGRNEIPDGVLEIVDTVISETRRMNNQELKDFCHKLKEYQQPPPQSRIPITAEEILKATGKSESEIKQVQSESASWALLHSALA